MSPDLASGWRVLTILLGWVVSLFGQASEIAGAGVLARGPARLLRRWLGLAERVARALVFAQAAQTPISNAPPRVWRGSSGAGYGRGGFACDDSAAWSVRTRFLEAPRKRTPGRRRARARSAPLRMVPSLPLAERLEALVRVAADPARAARRVARRAARTGGIVAPASAVALVSGPVFVEAVLAAAPRRRPPRRDSG